jgi:acyl-CoA reductase-like NAD-dependent aldehyde dehydrogenase
MIPIYNPATGDTVGQIPAGGRIAVDAAVSTAEEAFPPWSAKTPRERGKFLAAGAALVRARAGELATNLTREQGKPHVEAVDELRGFAHVLEYYAGLSSTVHGEAVSLGAAGDCLIYPRPLGVCAAIIPWNMPALLMAWKAAPSLLAGNTMVLKPSATAPLTCLALARALEEAGLPPGVLTLLTGTGEEAGEALVAHPGIRRVSFTGSTATGLRVQALAAGRPVRLTMELGGSDPMVVCADADIPRAVEGAVRGRFYNCGQTCTAVKRLYVEEAVAVQFTALLQERVAKIPVGNGLSPDVAMGPLHTAAGRDAVAALVNDAVADGARVLTGGEAMHGPEYDNGHFYAPTLITRVPPRSPLLTTEVFGPVLPIVPVPNLDAAIHAANQSPYALGASIWTKDLQSVRKFFQEIRAGVVWVNRHLTLPPEVPFGGTGMSGYGRENGLHALREYMEEKTLILGW